MRRAITWAVVSCLIVCGLALPCFAGHWSLAFWRELGKIENAGNLFIRVWTFDENGNMRGFIPITTPGGTALCTTNADGRVDMVMSVSNEYQMKVNLAGDTSDITPYMSNGRYPEWGHYSYELGFVYKSDINNPGVFDTSIVGGPVPRKGGTADNAPCTASMAFYSFNPWDWDSDAAGYDLPSGGWGEHGQTFVANGNRVACVQFHPTVSGFNNLINYTAEIRDGGPAGPVIASATSGWHYNQDWWIAVFPLQGVGSCPVVPGQTYFCRVYRPSGEGFNAYYARTDHWPAGLANGQAYGRPNSGSPWSLASNPDLKGFIVCCNVATDPPVILSSVQVDPDTGSAQITWNTDVPADSLVEYGTTSSYGKSVYDSSLVTNHSITLDGLHSDTTYHFKITCGAPNHEDGITTDQVFLTDSASPNLLVNGGFEAGVLSPWVKFGDFSNPNRSDGIGPWCTGKCPVEGYYDFVSITSYGTKDGGAYQRVSGVVPGETYTARMYHFTWQVGGNDSDCENTLGICPYGGTNPYSTTVVKTPPLSSQDTWTTASISAVAQSSTITVFLAAEQKWALEWNTNGFDDVRLTGPVAGSIPYIKGLPDGAKVSLTGKTVTATAGQIGAYYVQEPDRYNGIRVVTAGGSASVGNLVTVSGWLDTVNGERVIIDATITVTGSGQAKPLAITNKAVGGGDFNAVAKGATGGEGMNTVGLLVKVFGTVVSRSTGEFYITDGSGDPIRVDSSSSGTQPNVGDYVSVIGICRLTRVGSDYVPFVELRQTSDWLKAD